MQRTSAILFLLTILMACNPGSKESPQGPPHVILILADDMGYGDVSALNPGAGVRTPALDRLAEEGRYFTDAHSPSAVCTPTRYGLLTGRYCFRSPLKSGVLTGFSPPLLEPGQETLASMLGKAGYYSGCIGKWHLGLTWAPADSTKPLYAGTEWDPRKTNVDYSQPVTGGPNDHGFDYSFIFPASLDMQPYCYLEDQRVVTAPTDSTPGAQSERGVFWRYGDMAPGFEMEEVLPTLADEAESFIRRRVTEHPSQPFFLYLPLTAPHTPWVPSDSFRDKSMAGTYGDFVQQVDHHVGQLMAVLDELDIADNTLFMFTSDNGAHWTPADQLQFAHRANAERRGMKADVWDGGHRVPFIARWPGKVPPRSHSDAVICHTDLMATLAALAGQNLTEGTGEDSYNISPFLLGEQPDSTARSPVIHHSVSGVFSIRLGKWKYIPQLGSGGWTEPVNPEPEAGGPEGQLYDIEADPGERNNLYLQYPEVARELAALLAPFERAGKKGD